jgi:hypothetical protein
MKLLKLNPLFVLFVLVLQFSNVVSEHPSNLNAETALVSQGITSHLGQAIIDGYVLTKNGSAISNAVVYLADNPEFSNQRSTITDAAGYYKFDAVETMKDYYVKVYKNDQARDGISVLDLVILQKHLLGVKTFTTLDKVIGADANNSQNISAIDLIEIKKLLLGIYNVLPSNTSYRFAVMPFDYSGSTYQSVKIIQYLEADQRADFLGIKIGDLSGS